MALTYQTAFDLTVDAPMVQRVTIAGVRAALDIYAEGKDIPRAVLATKVLNAAEAYGRVFMFAIAVDPAIFAKTVDSVTDEDLLAGVKSAWDSVAGA